MLKKKVQLDYRQAMLECRERKDERKRHVCEKVTQERRELGNKRCYEHLVAEHSDHGNRGVRGPSGHPEQHVRNGHLGNLHLSACLVVLLVAFQRVNVHLLRLGFHGCFVGHHRLDNLDVEEDDGEHGDGVVEGKGVVHEGLLVPILSEIVVAAGDQKTFRSVATPPKERRHRHH